MKLITLFSLAAAAWLFVPTNTNAQPADSLTPAQAQLHDLAQKVQAKIKAGKDTEADYADELKAFDGLIAAQNGAKTDDAALIPYMKAMLYLEVLNNTNQGAQIIRQIKADYPDTKYGKNADRVLASIAGQAEARAKQAAAKKMQDAMFATGAAFPDFAAADLAGKPLSVAALKGKVVLVDFWAT
jgi:hypothetical protein